MAASDARGRDGGEAVIAALHPFAPLGTSGGFDRGDWINQTAQTVEVDVTEAPKLGNALAGRPKWVAGRPHRKTRSGA